MAGRSSRWTRDGVHRMLRDLIVDELGRLRPGLPPPDRAALTPEAWLGESPDGSLALGADSLELLSLATAASELFDLRESGLEDLLLARRRLGDWVELVLRARDLADGALTFRTSGSTGEPKACRHELDHLLTEVEALDALLRPARILAAVPAHHIYGCLFTVLLPAGRGLPVLELRDRPPASALAQARSGDVVVGHPAFYRLALRGAGTVSPGVTAVTSTAPCPAEIWDGLANLGLARVVEVYGASETAGIGYREASEAPFELFDHWRRAGAGIARNPGAGADKSLALPDALRWLDDRRFEVAGRRDGAVQVGGVNVYPERVRRALLTHPAVADAAVRPMAAAEGGRLKAFVVPRDPAADPRAVQAKVLAWAERHLRAPERPRAITVGRALPRNHLGKPADWSVEA